jgi:hypothetical protein
VPPASETREIPLSTFARVTSRTTTSISVAARRARVRGPEHIREEALQHDQTRTYDTQIRFDQCPDAALDEVPRLVFLVAYTVGDGGDAEDGCYRDTNQE